MSEITEATCQICGHLLAEHDEAGCNHTDSIEYHQERTWSGPIPPPPLTATKYCPCKRVPDKETK